MLVFQSLGLEGEVVVPSYTFMATVSAMRWAGLQPVFVDVDRSSTNVDPDAVRAAITPRTSAIVAVHNFGNPAAIAELEEIAADNGLALVFDAAHALGSLYQQTPIGSQGAAQAFSLSPTKLVIAGEGGLVTTNDDNLAAKIRVGREYGNDGNYGSQFAGLNGRMAELNALMASHSFAMLDEAVTTRNRCAELYNNLLGKLPGVAHQSIRRGDRHSYKDYCITIDEGAFGLSRNALSKALAAEQIDVRHYYDPPVHRHLAYERFAPREPLENTDWLSDHILCLPLWSKMDEDSVRQVGLAIERIWEHRTAVAELCDREEHA
jgi:dTDP-4-amino-4,6-dideoxygalactose transaminase